jgi:hypothetical protein
MQTKTNSKLEECPTTWCDLVQAEARLSGLWYLLRNSKPTDGPSQTELMGIGFIINDVRETLTAACDSVEFYRKINGGQGE